MLPYAMAYNFVNTKLCDKVKSRISNLIELILKVIKFEKQLIIKIFKDSRKIAKIP